LLIPPKYLQAYWGLEPKIIVHVGAHEAEELPLYQERAWGGEKIVFVEALPEKAEQLRQRFVNQPEVHIVEALAWSESGESRAFYEASNGESSSTLRFREHSSLYPSITVSKVHTLESRRLSEVSSINELPSIGLLNLDIQGSELRALQGLVETLPRVGAIYSEVNLKEVYEGNSFLIDIDSFLKPFGFELVDWEYVDGAWGDALWLRKVPLGPRALRRRARRLHMRLANILADVRPF
jgi:FkbM family methyltransferase